MKLLRELYEGAVCVYEGAEDQKKLYLQGTFMQAEVPNRNKRIYPIAVLQKEATRYLKENIEKKTAWGELNHPTGPNINLDRVCLRITEMKQDGNNFTGKALVTPTPYGNTLRGLVESGGQVGMSSRALGSLKALKDSEINEVQDDLRLCAIDCVGDPSAPEAWVNGVMEDIEYFYDGKSGEVTEKVKTEIKKMSISQITENQTRLFQSWLDEIARIK